MGKFEPASEVLLQAALRGKEAIFSWSEPAVVRLCLELVPSKRETAQGQGPESESPESLETLESTISTGVGSSGDWCGCLKLPGATE